MEKIDKAKVQAVYSGLSGLCYCGCAGKYYYSSLH